MVFTCGAKQQEEIHYHPQSHPIPEPHSKDGMGLMMASNISHCFLLFQ